MLRTQESRQYTAFFANLFAVTGLEKIARNNVRSSRDVAIPRSSGNASERVAYPHNCGEKAQLATSWIHSYTPGSKHTTVHKSARLRLKPSKHCIQMQALSVSKAPVGTESEYARDAVGVRVRDSFRRCLARIEGGRAVSFKSTERLAIERGEGEPLNGPKARKKGLLVCSCLLTWRLACCWCEVCRRAPWGCHSSSRCGW
jgi:hypothetical protein